MHAVLSPFLTSESGLVVAGGGLGGRGDAEGVGGVPRAGGTPRGQSVGCHRTWAGGTAGGRTGLGGHPGSASGAIMVRDAQVSGEQGLGQRRWVSGGGIRLGGDVLVPGDAGERTAGGPGSDGWLPGESSWPGRWCVAPSPVARERGPRLGGDRAATGAPGTRRETARGSRNSVNETGAGPLAASHLGD